MTPPVFAGTERAGPAHRMDESLTIAERDLAYSNDWFIRLRWIAGAGVLTGAFLVIFFPKTGVPALPLWIIGACILLYNLAFLLIARRAKTSAFSPGGYRRLAYAQMIADWLAITLLVQFTGGIVSPLTFFFVFHVVIASMFFTPRASFAFTFLAIFLFTTVVVLEYFSVLPHYPIAEWRNYRIYIHQDVLYVTAVWAFFSSTLIILTYLASGRSERLRRREAEVLKLSETLRLNSEKLQALNESAKTVNSTLELSQVLNHLVTNTAQVMRVRACSIRLLDKTGKLLEPAAVYGLSQEYLDKGPIELEHSLLDRKVLAGEVIHIPDVGHSSLLQYPDWAVQEGIFSMVSAPLIGKNKALGILRAYADGRDRFTPDDEAFLSAIAAQGSIAIENALAYQTIETLDATKAAFIRVFTHELRSPVSVIRSLLQTILSGYAGETAPQQRDILERAVRRVDFLRKLIDDLLDLANGRAPQQSQDSEAPVALVGVVENVVKRFEVPAQEKKQALEWHADPQKDEIVVRATVEGLDRIFNNLVSNAIRYTPEGGKVCVSISHTAKEVMVEVADTGIGIPAEAMPHLFEEFFRASNARSIEREGTGLGLSIVRETVNNLGGRVAVQSEVGVGTRFTVTLPLTRRMESP